MRFDLGWKADLGDRRVVFEELFRTREMRWAHFHCGCLCV
jgi:hypothetical protein